MAGPDGTRPDLRASPHGKPADMLLNGEGASLFFSLACVGCVTNRERQRSARQVGNGPTGSRLEDEPEQTGCALSRLNLRFAQR
jgi:hypothetical protein